MAGFGALLRLAAARARRRPAGWLVSVAGIALVLGYAGGVVAAATVTADRSARAALRAAPPADRAVRVTWQGVVTPRVRRQALTLLRGLGFPRPAEIVLMNPVRLGGTVVRPAAITPLGPWVTSPAPTGTCTPRACPVLAVSPAASVAPRSTLRAPSVRLKVIGTTALRSPAPLGFVPRTGSTAAPPVLLSADAPGLDRLSGLDAIYRTHSWLAPLAVGHVHAWELHALADRLRRAQARLLAANSGFSMTAPFTALRTAEVQAHAAPHRLWLAGGGAAAALVMFVVLAAGALRRDQALELDRLRNAGARLGQTSAFVMIEAGMLSGVGVLAGAAAGVLAAVVLADGAGASAAVTLDHSLITPGWIAVLAGTWLLASGLVGAGAAIRSGRIVDALALAGAVALALGVAVSHDGTGGDPLAVLVAPLCALAGGVLVFRLSAGAFRSGERLARHGPLRVRLALVGLARAPTGPALAAACLAVSVGLAGFALAYRSTLLRGAADEAADRVPLDALIAPGADFTRPLDVASLAAWEARGGGSVWPVRRADATYVSGGASVTIPALGVPAAVLPRIHGWRTTDGSAPLAALARRLAAPGGPLRTPGPAIVGPGHVLRLPIESPQLSVDVAAVLRARDGRYRQLSLGSTQAGQAILRARIPAGTWNLEGLELREGAGLEATNGHQNGENAAAATQLTASVRLGPLDVPGARLAAWRGVGAISGVRGVVPGSGGGAGQSGAVTVWFATNAVTGLLRPAQPSDHRPVPILIGPGVPRVPQLALTVDGQPLTARVVGTLKRFPTTGGGSFVLADAATLAAALDAQLPGEGAPDELWQLGGHRIDPPASLSYAWRGDLERELRNTPVAHAIVGAMIAAAGLGAALAIAGLLIALLGSLRDRRVEADLVSQGLSPRELRTELRLRIMITSGLGVATGIVIAVALTLLTLAAVRAGLGSAPPEPPLAASAPWGELAVLACGVLVACGLAGAVGSAGVVGSALTGEHTR